MLLPVNSRPLLYRSPLYPCESLSSYLRRLAIFNGYKPFSLLTRLIQNRLARVGIKDNPLLPRHRETFEVLSELTWVNPHELAAASIHRLAQGPGSIQVKREQIYLPDGQAFQLIDYFTRFRKLRQDGRAQFCPECLREAAYHSLAWVPWDSHICLKHRCLLVDQCMCGFIEVQVHEIVERRCSHCGADLADLATDYMLDGSLELFAQSTIQSWWGLSEPLDTTTWALPAEPPWVVYSLFDLLIRSIKTLWWREWDCKLVDIPPNAHLAQMVAFRALVNWPYGFWDFLAAHTQQERQVSWYYLVRSPYNLPRLLAQLSKWGESPSTHFILPVLKQFMTHNNVPVRLHYGKMRICWPER